MSVHYCPFQNGSLPSPKHTQLWRQSACSQERATSRKRTRGNNRSLLPSSLRVLSSWYFARSCTRGSRRGRGRWEERRGKCGISHQLEGRKGMGEVAEEPAADLFHPGKCSSGTSNARRAGEETTAGRGKTKRTQEAGEEGWSKPTG